MKMPLKQQQKQATEMPSPKIASNFPNPEIPKLYDPTQSHETTQPEREQKNFPRLPFGLQQQKVAMDPTQNSNRKTEMPSVDHSVSSREGNRSTFEAACRGNPFSFAPFEMESDEACKRGGADRGNGAEEMS
ncbi:hypothetical protein LXL04_015430 [Taraxacum kok-saghyz]